MFLIVQPTKLFEVLQKKLQMKIMYYNSIYTITMYCNPGGYLGQVLLDMCRWPLRTPTPLQSILWPTIDPILVTFGQMSL